MLLYLLRHAEAEPHRADDFSRRLTDKGCDQARRVGNFLQSEKIGIDLIVTSPVLRARETAKIVAGKLGDAEFIEASWLACGMNPENGIKELTAYSRFESIMIVGHEPDFSALIATLLGLSRSSSLNVSKASLTAIEFSRLGAGAGVLKFLLPVKLLPS